MPFHPSDEERVAADMTRELEAMTMTSAPPVSDDFADRVMAAIADEPLPQPVRAFGLALRRRPPPRGAARRSAMRGGRSSSTRAPLSVRAQALALVLVVVVGSLGLAGGAAVGALGLLDGSRPSPDAERSAAEPAAPSVARRRRRRRPWPESLSAEPSPRRSARPRRRKPSA